MGDHHLSVTMREAVSNAQLHGNKLTRFPGGFWAHPEWKFREYPWFSAPTIQALVSRGVAEYTAWRDRKGGGRFPIEVTVTERQAGASVSAHQLSR